jgi:hypothetical protein
VARKSLGFVLTAALMTALSANAAPLPRYGIFMFSSACWEEESGDAAGNRALLIRDGDGDRLFWEWSEGPMEGPAQATALSIDAKSGAIVFDVDIGSMDTFSSGNVFAGKEPPDIVHFTGRVSDKALTLRTDDGSWRGGTQIMPRLRNFSAKTPMCGGMRPR